MKRLLRQVPGLVPLYRHASFLYRVARDRWFTDNTRMNDQSHLDGDWDFQSPIERQRHELVLAAAARLLPRLGQAQVLELGCSDGVFTGFLASRCARVTACDISAVALELAAGRCREFPNVSFLPFDLATQQVRGEYDAIFLMDVLEFVHGRRLLKKVVGGLAAALAPGGVLVYSSCRLDPALRDAFWQRWLPEGGDAVRDLIAEDPALDLVHDELHPGDGIPLEGYLAHVIALYRKRGDTPPAEAAS